MYVIIWKDLFNTNYFNMLDLQLNKLILNNVQPYSNNLISTKLIKIKKLHY